MHRLQRLQSVPGIMDFMSRGCPPFLILGGESPPKRHKASAKEASPRLTQEMPRTPSSDEERNTPTASGQVAEPMPDHDAAAPDHENLEDAAASASAVLGEEPFVPDWGDSNVQTECAAASNDLGSGEQTANRDGLGPIEEDAAVEPPEASGQVRGESHGSTDEIIYICEGTQRDSGSLGRREVRRSTRWKTCRRTLCRSPTLGRRQARR